MTAPDPIRALVWNEHVHERESPAVASIYPDGIHGCIAAALGAAGGIVAETATLADPGHGLDAARLARTDVLLWWGHVRHADVSDAAVEAVLEAVWGGMGLVALHSAHFSRPFRRLTGTPCNLSWRVANERERLWTTSPGHPIAAGVPAHFELEPEEMYGEPFGVPEPDETVFVSWFEGGEVFRSGLTWRRGRGRLFYFRPGHETCPTYHDPNVRRVLANAVRWAARPGPRPADVAAAPNRPADAALEPLGRPRR